MKKSILLILLSGMLACVSLESFSQMYGRWVLGTCYSNSAHETLLITFNENAYQLDTLPMAWGDSHCEFALGGYNSDYDLLFYTIDDSLYYNDNSMDYTTFFGQTFRQDCQIIDKPGSSDSSFYLFVTGQESGKIGGFHCMAYPIVVSNNGPVIGNNTDITHDVLNSSSVGVAVSNEEFGERKLYDASLDYKTVSKEIIPAGIRERTISSSGIGNMTSILTAGGNIANEDFSVYNLELLEINGEDILAWITTNPSSIDKVFIYDEDNNDEYVHDLNLGRIGGIEFSGLNDSILYVSCRDTGIVALNYFTGNIEEIVYSDANNNYRTTSLQTAPDGNIYGVSYDGRYLGRINMPEGGFSHEVLQIAVFPYNLSTYRTFDSEKYYRLPENSRQFDYLDVALIDKIDVCPGDTSGWAEIGATGGFPEYTYTLYKLLDGDTVLVETVTTEDESYIFQNLSMGYYFCIVSDTHGNEVTVSFFIEEDDDAFDVKVMDTISQFEPEYWTNVQRSYYRGFEIMPGVSVSITDSSILQFGRDARVIIHPGAELIVQNSALTHFIECDTMWRGIEVRGDSEEHQYTLNDTCRQGKLLLNNALISNAYTAVALYGTHYDSARAEWRTHWNESGGIVQAVSSRFINNRKSIHFVPYRNYLPNNPAQEMDNLSYIDLCLFEVNQDYIPNHIFYKHVDLHDVKGISFEGCTFTNSGTEGISNYCQGIASYASDFKANFYCTQAVSPCPDSIRGSFSGFYRAIGAYGSISSYKTFQVIGNNFQNNHTGVFVAGVNDNVIVDNHFEIGLSSYDMDDCEGTPTGFGVDMQGATGFAIEDNYFTKNSFAPDGKYVGVRISNTESGYDEIYRNIFENLSYANLAEKKNWHLNNIWEGLAYYCNDNTSNWADFWVEPDDEPGWTSGIQARQGDDFHAAGNTFSSSADWHFYNGGDFEVGYYYNMNSQPEIPADNKLYHVTDEARDVENTCPDHYGGGGIELSQSDRQQKEIDYSDNLSNYTSVEYQYNLLIDGGDTEAELNDIQTAQPDDMWDLRAQLLGDSPHLSLEVLMETSDRTDVFPDEVLLDILSANPDELKKDTLISYLENKEDPLPDYMIDILQQVATGTSYKTVLQNEMAEYNKGKSRAAHDIVRSILADSIIDITDLRNWFDNIGGKRADEQIISSYLFEENYTDALALANIMPDLYNYSGIDSIEHTYFTDLLNLKIAMKQQDRNIFQLDSNEMTTLLTLANNSLSSAGVQARGLLEYAYGYNYCNCTSLGDTAAYKSDEFDFSSLDKLHAIKCTVTPNPASSWVAFNYYMPGENSKGMLKITDISGKTIRIFSIYENRGQIIWDTRMINNGLYFYTLESNGKSVNGKILIQR